MMTLIVGVRCSDGVVLGSDRKVLRGAEVEYSNKVFTINNIAYAVEGLTGVADDFLYLFDLELKRRKGVDSLYEAKILAEDIVAELTERYRDRVQQSPVGILMAGLDNLSYGKAQLYYIHGEGYGERIDFVCSGHGGPYATSLAKFLLDKKLTVDENAKRTAFIISYVAEDVDVSVGGSPVIAMIKDSEKQPVQEAVRFLEDNIVEKMVTKAKESKEKLPEFLGLVNI